MLIIGDEILKQGLLTGADKNNIKNASYYLTIGSIIPAGEEARKYDFDKPNPMLVIKPGQVAWVVSQEVFNIKSHGVTALVTLRSTFTKKGLLALDVGMVDPDFEGPIGSIVINFSKVDIPLSVGEPFFRVVFMEHPVVAEEYRTPRVQTTRRKYIMDRHEEIVRSYPATFLNTELLSAEIDKKVSEKVGDDLMNQALLYLVKNYWGKLLIGVLAFGAVVGFVVYLLYVNFGPSLSRQDVQSAVKTWIEQNFPKEPPPRK